MSVSKRTRFEVLRRDNHTCRYCGGVAPDVILTVDHVTPVALGGTDDPANLVAACQDCNAGKSSTSPSEALVEQVSEDAIRWAEALKQAAAVEAAKLSEREVYVQQFNDAWNVWHYGPREEKIPRPGNWRQSVLAWRDAGLPIESLVDAVQIAGGRDGVSVNDMWRYMCGVAWKKVRELQRIAEEIVKAGEADGS